MKHFLYPLACALAIILCVTPAPLIAAQENQPVSLKTKIVLSVLLVGVIMGDACIALDESFAWTDGQPVSLESYVGILSLFCLGILWKAYV